MGNMWCDLVVEQWLAESLDELLDEQGGLLDELGQLLDELDELLDELGELLDEVDELLDELNLKCWGWEWVLKIEDLELHLLLQLCLPLLLEAQLAWVEVE